MPTTSPFRLNSGPPELPGLIGTSVWMNGTRFSLRQLAPLGADDAGGDRVLQAERLADRGHPFADLELVGIADRHLGQSRGLDLEQGDVGALVGADDLGLEFALVGQLHRDFAGIVDDVGVGQHVAVGGQDEARAGRLLLEVARTRLAARDLPEAAKEFVERVVLGNVGHRLAARRLRDVDADHRRALLLVELGEVRQAP